MPKLTANNYGKSGVRLTKVVRNGKNHTLHEYEVSVICTGEFAAAYTDGDNRNLMATDSIKNTVYVIAKENPFSSAEEFGILLAGHFANLYKQVKGCVVSITEARWDRIKVGGKPHVHSFVNGGSELHTSRIEVLKKGKPPAVFGGLTNLMVLKTTNSAWKDFWSDRYRTLKDTDDRILATSVTAEWEFSDTATDFVAGTNRIRTVLLETFATHESLGAQQTMYAMGEMALKAEPSIKSIRLRLPNQHRIPFNLEPFGLTFENDIFVWTDEPYGDISALIER